MQQSSLTPTNFKLNGFVKHIKKEIATCPYNYISILWRVKIDLPQYKIHGKQVDVFPH